MNQTLSNSLQWLADDLVTAVELGLALIALGFAFALRRRKWRVSSRTFGTFALGLALGTLPAFIGSLQWISPWIRAFAVIVFCWGLVQLVIELISRRRDHAHDSSVPQQVLMIVLCLLVAAIVLHRYRLFDITRLALPFGLLSGGLVFALQEPLRNIATGLSFHITKPFRSGDWVRFQNQLGFVKATRWASTEIVTRSNERVQIPNSMLINQPVMNFRNDYIADEITVGISYEEPPGRVKEAILKVARDIPHVLADPPPQVFAWEYGDYAIKYRVRYYLADYGPQEIVRDTLVSSLWYALRRHAIDIPFPTQTLEVRRPQKTRSADGDYEKEIFADLRRVDFLRELSDDELRMLLPNVGVHQFGAGEVIVREGEAADSFFIIRSGAVAISTIKNGKEVPLAETTPASPSPYFGEIAMMSGEPRTATIRASAESEVLVMSRQGFVQLFKEHPELADSIGEIIALRQHENSLRLADHLTHTDGSRGFIKEFVGKMRHLFDI